MYNVNTDCNVYGVSCVWSKMISGKYVFKRKEKREENWGVLYYINIILKDMDNK